MINTFTNFNLKPGAYLSLGAECVVKLHAFNGYSVVVEDTNTGSKAWCIVEVQGVYAILELPFLLYTPFVRAGAVAGKSYLITRNANAKRNVYSVREANNNK